MKISLLIIFLSLMNYNQAQSDDILKLPKKTEVKKHIPETRKPTRPKISHQTDIFNIEFNNNGDFGKKFKLGAKSNHKSSEIDIKSAEITASSTEINLQSAKNNRIIAEIIPSKTLEPPYPYYSTDEAITENVQSTTIQPEISAMGIKQLRIYEITSMTSTTQRSFVISDPSAEMQSYDSLRSVFLSGSSRNRSKPKNVRKSDGFDGKYQRLEPKNDVIRTNPLKGYASRGNRKYQHHESDSDEISARRNSWGATRNRYIWTKVRPINRDNHLRFIDSNAKIGAVPGEPGRDYPIHQEHIHLQLRSAARRFICPVDAYSPIYLADRASRCQIFYVCFGTNSGVPMICPNGTLFSQELQVCDWWFNVIC